MTYLVSGRLLTLQARRLGMFWGASPHQVVRCAPGSDIVVIYVPLPAFLVMMLPPQFRRRIMGGGYVVDRAIDPADAILLPRWHGELAAGGHAVGEMVRHEIACRIRRFADDGGAVLRGLDIDARPAALGEPAMLGHVRTMVMEIAMHCHEPIRVGDVAAAAGLHPNYAMALFRKAIGVTVADFIVRQRLGAAQAMLAETACTIAEVQRRSGFGSRSAFYDAFAQRVGVSPSSYRAAMADAIRRRSHFDHREPA